MCGRYTFQPTEAFYRRFNIANRLDGLVARYNIAPSQLVPVIISQSPNHVMLMRWGLIPFGQKTYPASTSASQTEPHHRFRGCDDLGLPSALGRWEISSIVCHNVIRMASDGTVMEGIVLRVRGKPSEISYLHLGAPLSEQVDKSTRCMRWNFQPP
jgi:hypothetical protein